MYGSISVKNALRRMLTRRQSCVQAAHGYHLPMLATDDLKADVDLTSVARWIDGPLLARANAALADHGQPPLPPIRVDFSLSGLAAGQARWSRNEAVIRLNRALFDLPDAETIIRETAAHEMAHLCQFAAAPGARPHGRIWARYARALGASIARCHRLPLPRARRRREFRYVAGGDDFWLGAVRHRRLQEGRANYRARVNGRLVRISAADFSGDERWRG